MIIVGDVVEQLQDLPEDFVQCVVTSPPYYGLRNYAAGSQEIGREATADEYVEKMVKVFSDVRRVLCSSGVLWLNLGDCYAKDKQRQMIPARVALALQLDGWWLRDEVVWHKPNTTPNSFKDRTVPAHEMLYLLTKNPRYYFDYLAIEEPAKYAGTRCKTGKVFRQLKTHDPLAAQKRYGRDGDEEIVVRATRRKRSVWSISTSPYTGAHFATFPPLLVEPCVLAGSRKNDFVLDPFCGSGTTGAVAKHHGRQFIGIELNPEYALVAEERIAKGWQPS